MAIEGTLYSSIIVLTYLEMIQPLATILVLSLIDINSGFIKQAEATGCLAFLNDCFDPGDTVNSSQYGWNESLQVINDYLCRRVGTDDLLLNIRELKSLLRIETARVSSGAPGEAQASRILQKSKSMDRNTVVDVLSDSI